MPQRNSNILRPDFEGNSSVVANRYNELSHAVRVLEFTVATNYLTADLNNEPTTVPDVIPRYSDNDPDKLYKEPSKNNDISLARRLVESQFNDEAA